MTLTFAERVDAHQTRLRARGGRRQFAETAPPTGQAGRWYDDVRHQIPRHARETARQLARLCGDDSKVTIPWRSLADALTCDEAARRPVSYAQRGVHALIEAGWLRVQVVGQKRGAKTTFYLLVGEPPGPASARKEDAA